MAKKEQIALVQFVALFDDLKKDGSEWPTFGNRHDYWNKLPLLFNKLQEWSFEDMVSPIVVIYNLSSYLLYLDNIMIYR